MTPQRRVLAVRRAAITVGVVALALVFLAAFVGLGIPALVIIPAAWIAVVAALVWLVLFLVDRRAADRHAAQGRSWRPDGTTAG